MGTNGNTSAPFGHEMSPATTNPTATRFEAVPNVAGDSDAAVHDFYDPGTWRGVSTPTVKTPARTGDRNEVAGHSAPAPHPFAKRP